MINCRHVLYISFPINFISASYVSPVVFKPWYEAITLTVVRGDYTYCVTRRLHLLGRVALQIDITMLRIAPSNFLLE